MRLPRSSRLQASHTEWTCDRTNSSFVRSSRGASTSPETISSCWRKKYWSWLLPDEQNVVTSAACPPRPARPERWA